MLGSILFFYEHPKFQSLSKMELTALLAYISKKCQASYAHFLISFWSAGALVALLCGDTVTLSNEDKFPERD